MLVANHQQRKEQPLALFQTTHECNRCERSNRWMKEEAGPRLNVETMRLLWASSLFKLRTQFTSFCWSSYNSIANLKSFLQGQPTSGFGGINNENIQVKSAKPGFPFGPTTQPFASQSQTQSFQIHVDRENVRNASLQCQTTSISERLHSNLTDVHSLPPDAIAVDDSSPLSNATSEGMHADFDEVN